MPSPPIDGSPLARELPVLGSARAPAGPRRQDDRELLSRTMLRSVGEYGLVEEGDTILVAVSGGKDSMTLLDLLWRARRKAPVAYDLVAVHLDQGHPGYDGGPLRRWLEAFGAPFEILHEDTFSVVVGIASRDGSTFCGPCSRLRRGILYTAAERLGCNKVALGHHRDDAIETLFLNLFHAGRLQAMPARYTTRDGRFEVIRPLIECPEDAIARHAEAAGYPILPCNLCGSQHDLKRERVARLIADLEKEEPHIRQVMLAALKNVRATHLLDREVAEAWEAAASRYAPRR